MRVLFTFLLCLFSLLSFGRPEPNYVQGEILIQTSYPIQEILNDYQRTTGFPTDLKLKKVIAPSFNLYQLQFDYRAISTTQALHKIRNNPKVDIAQLNHIIEHRSTTPDDAIFHLQYQHVNTGQSGGTAGVDLDTDLAWDITTGGITPYGDTIVAAILDDGIDIDHPDIAPNLWVNHKEIPNDGIDNDNNGYIDDYKGWNSVLETDSIDDGGTHGTPVAGIVGAKGNNGLGVSGVNWDIKLMIIKGVGNEAQAISSYTYCYEQRKIYNESNGREGAYVVVTNASWGVTSGKAEDFPIWCSLYDSMGEQGILSCGAAVNSNVDIDIVGDMPAVCTSDFLIGVTNIDHNGQKITGAGYGAKSIDLGAFGKGAWTTSENGNYTPFGGTSGATPHVSGTVALMYAVHCNQLATLSITNPKQAALLVRKYILEGVVPEEGLKDITVTGGRLNTYNAVKAVVDNCSSNSCPIPRQLGAEDITEKQANISWTFSQDEVSQVDIRYKKQGQENWVLLSNVTSPLMIDTLASCTKYEMEARSICNTDTTSWTNYFIFETDGCCVPPANITSSNLSENAATLSWSDVLIAKDYNLRYKSQNETEWITQTNITSPVNLVDLIECDTYEIQVSTNCTSGITTDYSALVTFTTKGCGVCVDADYCPSRSKNSSGEWIENLTINTINNTSGNNNGYGNYTHLSTNLMQGKSYPISLTAGFPSNAFSEYFMVWIDYNQDGDFDDEGEEFDPKVITKGTLNDTITIPSNALLGSTRMRIAMHWQSPVPACHDIPFEFGEVEDYCINIIDDTTPTIDIETNTISISPNPFDHQLNITAPSNNWDYRLLDVNGRIVQSGHSNSKTLTISVSDIPKGIYFIQILDDKTQHTQKLIKG